MQNVAKFKWYKILPPLLKPDVSAVFHFFQLMFNHKAL